MKKFSPAFIKHFVSNAIIATVLLGVLLITLSSNVVTATGGAYQPFYRGNTSKPQVSLMINVYWGTEFVQPMLDILAETNTQATFFIGGTWANKNNEVLKAIHESGNEIGNHGYYHKDHKLIDKQRNEEEIYITHALVKSLINYDMTLFAPPSGSFSKTTLEVAQNLGYQTIMWTKDTIDWRDKSRDLVYNRAIKNPQNGDLILMHPTEHTLAAFRDIINFYKSKNFSVVTVSSNIAL